MTDLAYSKSIDTVVDDVIAEIHRSNAKHGQQLDMPDGTDNVYGPVLADAARRRCEIASERGEVSWWHVLDEEAREAFAETDPVKLRAELLQVAAVAIKWAIALDLDRTSPVAPAVVVEVCAA